MQKFKGYRVLIPGGAGRLAQVLRQALDGQCAALWAPSRSELDLLDGDLTQKIQAFRPHWIIHGAGMTSVNACEATPELAFEINGRGTQNLVLAAAKLKARGIYISTDYVFGGEAGGPLHEGAQVNPINAYGRSKVQGELAALAGGWAVGRCAWLWGDGRGFPQFIVEQAREKGEVVVAEQWGTPTHLKDLAEALIALGPQAQGIYHLVGARRLSRAQWAAGILEGARLSGISIIEKSNQAIFHNQAPRPVDTALRIDRQDGPHLRGFDPRRLRL